MQNNLTALDLQNRYELVVSAGKTDNIEELTVYGIRITNIQDENDFEVIYDISIVKSEIEELIRKLRDGNVTPDQLGYIVEDFIAEK